MSNKLPLVIILGATACGKSRLAIELACRFGGEIISADSMQIYAGLDIVTNKVTGDEKQQAKHHMIDCISPLQRFCVVDFQTKSLDIIGDLMKKSSLPIVVGGTNYYIESLIWKGFLVQTREDDLGQGHDRATLIDTETEFYNRESREAVHTDEDLADVQKFFLKPIYNEGFGDIPSEKLWKILEQVDSESAHLYHMHDKRRIIRCLQIIQKKRRNYSDLLRDVNVSSSIGKSSLGGPLRFDPTCVLWLNCDEQLLDKIVEDRIDQMLNRGLLDELEKFHADYNMDRIKHNEKPDYYKGVFQTIGFKEFHEYLILDPEVKKSERGNKILQKSINEMKQSTKRFARKQLRWIRRRFMQLGTRDLPPLFKLTTTYQEEEWETQVKEPACRIVESFIDNRPLSADLQELKQEPKEPLVTNNPGKYHCETCDRVFIGSHYIQAHLESRGHKRRVKESRDNIQL